MNKYVRGLIIIPYGFIKTVTLKLFHPLHFSGVQLAQISPFSEITISSGKLKIEKKFKMRDGAKIRVRKNAQCLIGKNVSINTNNIIACRKYIEIGEGCEFGPNVQIYDHDHDFRCAGGIHSNQYNCADVVIGKNCWIGANTIILKNTRIGDNVVVAAGSIVRGNIDANSIFVQKKVDEVIKYEK